MLYVAKKSTVKLTDLKHTLNNFLKKGYEKNK